ncbi:MAG: hypothetical protein ACTSWM_00170 [Alphaproteobacteria bacterium]
MAGFLGQDWSWDNFKGKGKGLLSDPNQMLESPWFNMGMGILSENSKVGGGDPFGAAVSGMRKSKVTKQQRQDRERIEELRKQLAELIRARQAAAQAAQGGPQMSPIPPGSQPTSIMEYMK